MNVHQNARLTPHSRAELVQWVVVEGQTPKAVAAAFNGQNRAASGWRVFKDPKASKACR